jgi:copper chaperone CopZ
VTLFAAIMLAFPYYSTVFYPETNINNQVLNESLIQTIELNIDGMTCTGCEDHIKYVVAQEAGYIEVEASYQKGIAVIKYDKSLTNKKNIINSISKTGYQVIIN